MLKDRLEERIKELQANTDELEAAIEKEKQLKEALERGEIIREDSSADTE